MDALRPSDESRVLIIYTGGTIGMLVGRSGYVPEANFLTETLRSQTRFHDPRQDSLFSNSSSVEGFREWSSSGGSTPLRTPTPPPNTTSSFSHLSPLVNHPTLLVSSSRPIHQPTLSPMRSDSEEKFFSRKNSDGVYQADLPSLVTPRSIVPGMGSGKRIRYAILEWNPLLDSSNIEIDDWIRIATEIELNYSFDAFVVLHGTDTMAYTSSALSFLLEDLGKTVIITGAQIPLSQLRNDAVDNLMGALSIAGHYIIPECCLFFNHTLFRGNRVSKTSSYDLNAFNSPNFTPLVNVGIDIVVNWNDVIRQTSLRRFRAHKHMSPHVGKSFDLDLAQLMLVDPATLRLFPGITAATVRAFLMPPTCGVVLETFGAGNAQQRLDLMAALKEACDRGIVVVAISQCAKGSVNDAYETGRTLLQAGVVPGGDMTGRCTLTKLSYLLSKPELSPAEVRTLMGTSLRGELTRPSGLAPNQHTVDNNLEHIQGLLSQFIRLSQPLAQVPSITVSSDDPSVEESAHNATAPWSWTAAEAGSAEAALLPFLMHLAAARDDVENISRCLVRDLLSVETQSWNIHGGIVNCLDPGSGRSPLHVAALNGNTRSVNTLLKSGALVHLRDSLDHTALYYAARQGHEDIVDVLVQAGATLGGYDLEGSFAKLAVKTAPRSGDQALLRIWNKAGIQIPMDANQ